MTMTMRQEGDNNSSSCSLNEEKKESDHYHHSMLLDRQQQQQQQQQGKKKKIDHSSNMGEVTTTNSSNSTTAAPPSLANAASYAPPPSSLSLKNGHHKQVVARKEGSSSSSLPPVPRPSPPPPPSPMMMMMMMNGGRGTAVAAAAAAAYHPDFMFCGECTTCVQPSNNEENDDDDDDGLNKRSTSFDSCSSSSMEDFLDNNDDNNNDDEHNIMNDRNNRNARGLSSSSSSSPTTTITTLVVSTDRLGQKDNNKNDQHTSKLVLQSLLQPMDGVLHVRIITNNNGSTSNSSSNSSSSQNTTTTTTLQVQHNAACQSNDLCRVLSQAGYTPLSVAVSPSNSSSSNESNNANTRTGNENDTTNTNTTTTTTVTLVRSTFRVRGICCASEVPSIRRILRPLPAVSSVQISIPTQRVYVHHAVGVHYLLEQQNQNNNNDSNNNCSMSAQEIARLLTTQGFPATVIKNGAANLATNTNNAAIPLNNTTATAENGTTTTTTTVGRTALHAVATLHNQDAPHIQQLLFGISGIHRIGVNVAESVIYVEHDYAVISATKIQECLAPDYNNNEQNGNSNSSSNVSTAAARPYYPTMLVGDAAASAAAAAANDESTGTIAMVDARGGGGGAESSRPPQSPALLPRSKYVETTLQISNLQTRKHVQVLEKALAQQYIRAQIKAIYPHLNSKTCKVQHNPVLVAAENVVQTLSQYGLQATILTDGGAENLFLPLSPEEEGECDNGPSSSSSKSSSAPEWEDREQMHLNVWLSGVFWVVSMLSYIEGLEYLQYAGLGAVAFGLPPVAVKAWRTLRRREFDANCMMLTAAVGALLLGELDEAASVSFLFAVSEFLEARASYKARMALQAICQLQPEHAHVMDPVTRQMTLLPAHAVSLGSLLCVRTGDKIAADGIIIEGTSQVDESSLTGESMPVDKRVNDKVAGGTMNIGTTPLIVQTTSTSEDSAVSRLIRLVEEAQAHTSPTEKMIDAFARAYTPAVLVVAALCCTIPWFWGTEVGRYWTLNGLIIIVIACPCALTISTPVTYAAALAATAQRGIVVKGGGDCLEALGSVETVLLDKTGTITQGKFQILHLQEIGDFKTRREMLELLALLEGPSSHPISATLAKAAQQEAGTVSSTAAARRVENHVTLKGEGVTAVVDGQQVYVGNTRLFERLGMYESLPTAYRGLAQEWSTQGGSVGFVGVASSTSNETGGICGIFCVTDKVRPEAAQVLESLQRHGVKVEMLTGDGKGSALAVAEQVGISPASVHARLLPEDKLHHVKRLKTAQPTAAPGGRFRILDRVSFLGGLLRRKPRVLFCGDGVNDAPALAVADVGVSMGEGVGTALAMEMSDVTLMDSSLRKLEYVLNMGTRVVFTIQENIIISLACKVLVVVLTFAGYMTLLYAIASDVGVMLLVTLNGMKLLPGRADGALARRTRMKQRRLLFRPRITYDEVPLEGVQHVATATAAYMDDHSNTSRSERDAEIV